MLIGNSNTLLNILLPNQDNKVLKEVLKEADNKELTNMLKNNTSMQEVLKNLFEDIKSGNKSNETIQNILKNSSIFKDLGSFTATLKTLVSQLQNDEKLSKFKPLLESFLTQIDNLDENTLKDLIGKSGVFLESKILEKATSSNLPPKVNELLNQIKNILQKINTPEAKQINELIDKLVSTPNQTPNQIQTDIKSVINLLQNISKNLTQDNTQNLNILTNQLKSITQEAQLVESKLQNTFTNDNIKNLVEQIKSQLSLNKNFEATNLLRTINTLPNNDFSQVETKQALQNILMNLDFQAPSIKTPTIELLTTKLQGLIQTPQNSNINLNDEKSQILNQTKQILFQLKSEVLSNKAIEPNKLLSQIDNLLNMKDMFLEEAKLEPKNILQQFLNSNELKNSSSLNSNISNLVNQLKNLTDEIGTLENKIQNNQPILNEKPALLTQIKENLNLLKNELLFTNTIQTKVLNQVIDKLLNIQNLFDKIELPTDFKMLQVQNNNISSFQSNFASNINSLLLNLKENITNISSNPNATNLQNEILKTVDKIEDIIKQGVLTTTSLSKPDNSTLQEDMKSVLLQMQDMIPDKNSETSKAVDKLLFQVDYYQLLSLTSNSNYVYLPFLWDMLEDGSISMKKTNEKKFYCEINLTLKDFGQTQLLLGLYDKNKLDLTIFASRDSFKKLIRENLTSLKQSLNAAGLIPMDIKLIDLKKNEEKKQEVKSIYEQNSNFGFGVDIRA
ncbi:flagellar hook-length control protein FliK [Malaciobacter mytili]|uniref:flagellar hook-length control protein FliK n=1 Tax=Malaciobacter mytili TaxID=603050 RepID=UPI003BB031D9